MKEFFIASESQLSEWVPVLFDILGDKTKLALIGNLGVGKTTLIKYLCQHLGVRDPVVSPTFSLVNEYSTDTGVSVFHIDLYRLESMEEALLIGIEEYLDSEAYVFIEWPQLVDTLLGEDFMRVEISVANEQGRKIVIL
ncbi:MAG: tRNA (adenosine(37)-N6)-threonylcarbamoyltransferase complex ATPase subunit type 1 TsaE [Saprospiraceae bacterium]|nr:tRNA (adenosine(37)-N6)-threonylcarbamoyltransferase complex ATPase subunit type 1 TsaE [Saprospiraceae bacterium]